MISTQQAVVVLILCSLFVSPAQIVMASSDEHNEYASPYYILKHLVGDSSVLKERFPFYLYSKDPLQLKTEKKAKHNVSSIEDHSSLLLKRAGGFSLGAVTLLGRSFLGTRNFAGPYLGNNPSHYVKPMSLSPAFMKWLAASFLAGYGLYSLKKSSQMDQGVFFSKGEDALSSSFDEVSEDTEIEPSPSDPHMFPVTGRKDDDMPSHHRRILLGFGVFQSDYYGIFIPDFNAISVDNYEKISDYFLYVSSTLESLRAKLVVTQDRVVRHKYHLGTEEFKHWQDLIGNHIFLPSEIDALRWHLSDLNGYESIKKYAIFSYKTFALKLIRFGQGIERWDKYLKEHHNDIAMQYHSLNQRVKRDVHHIGKIFLGMEGRFASIFHDQNEYSYLFQPIAVVLPHSLSSDNLNTFELFDAMLSHFSRYMMNVAKQLKKVTIFPDFKDVNILLAQYSSPNDRLKFIVSLLKKELFFIKKGMLPYLNGEDSNQELYQHGHPDVSAMTMNGVSYHDMMMEEEEGSELSESFLGKDLIASAVALKKLQDRYHAHGMVSQLHLAEWQHASALHQKEFIHLSLYKKKIYSHREKQTWELGSQLLAIFLNLHYLRMQRENEYLTKHAPEGLVADSNSHTFRDSYESLGLAEHHLWGYWGNKPELSMRDIHHRFDKLIKDHGISERSSMTLRSYISAYPYLHAIRGAVSMGLLKNQSL
ncbi:MAG: hypothetical protein OXC44_03155 [Proteobacteria bacterium]|nr:hypothetical protein [Pseudomonadota bacterium]